MALTTRIPPELVIRVFDFVDPPTIVDLACSCKFLERCSRDILRKHRDLRARYRLVTDVDPRSFTGVLRRTLADRQIAWHVRDLEFTCARAHWSHWQTSDINKEVVDDSGMADLSLPPDYAFTLNEQIDLLNLFREVFHFDEETIDVARADLQQGNDAPLKLLLFGACPRLRCVKFTRSFRVAERCTIERKPSDDPHDKPRSSLEYFHQAILLHLQNNTSPWPVGLASLQDLAIGVDAGNETHDLTFAPSALLFANCMHLPHLTSLYCFGLRVPWEDPNEHPEDHTGMRYEIEKGSSSVHNIFLDCALGLHEAMGGIIEGCAQLKSLTIASSDLNDIDAVVSTADYRHRQSMETLMFYTTDMLRGYRCNMFRPESMEHLTRLRTVYVDASDVMLDAMSECDDFECGEEHEWVTDHEGFVKYYMNSAFPSSIEVLVIGAQWRSELSEGDANLFDQAITTMIEYGRVAEGEERDSSAKPAKVFERSFPNLKAVYLSSLDEVDHAPVRRKRWFANAIAAGRKFGVDVHTRTTRSRPFHQVDFPKPPRLTLDESAEKLLVFDVYTGEWAPPKCGNCGTCWPCLEQYDASVWREVEEEHQEGRP